jgi:alkanesulfonate monooxygenase SsuD/methylene tetrahydromethanopterin reductase-like flavin-dependent oxidoreductase (luciferase family)
MAATRQRGVGIEGMVGADAAAELAALAESCGYGSFWINVVGPDIDPFRCMQRSLVRTRDIEIGMGLFPLDRYPAVDLARQLQAVEASNPRVILGVAGGQMKQGVVRTTAEAVRTLRAALPQCRIATGGYGPKMLELGGALADVVLGNWLTPERLSWFMAQVEAGARNAGRPAPPIYLYHRAASGEDAKQRLRREFADYRRYPVHAKHQASMGNPQWVGIACQDRGDIGGQLAPYVAHCTVVLKPLPHAISDVDEWQSLIRFFAP